MILRGIGNYCCQKKSKYISGRSKGDVKHRPPGGPNSFNFMQLLGKFWQNRMMAPPPGGLASPPRRNPESATVYHESVGKYTQFLSVSLVHDLSVINYAK